jgi:hypothetical protein
MTEGAPALQGAGGPGGAEPGAPELWAPPLPTGAEQQQAQEQQQQQDEELRDAGDGDGAAGVSGGVEAMALAEKPEPPLLHQQSQEQPPPQQQQQQQQGQEQEQEAEQQAPGVDPNGDDTTPSGAPPADGGGDDLPLMMPGLPMISPNGLFSDLPAADDPQQQLGADSGGGGALAGPSEPALGRASGEGAGDGHSPLLQAASARASGGGESHWQDAATKLAAKIKAALGANEPEGGVKIAALLRCGVLAGEPVEYRRGASAERALTGKVTAQGLIQCDCAQCK